MVKHKSFNIHGDNIVECIRIFNYVTGALSDLVVRIAGPTGSVTCPIYMLELEDCELSFQFFPGYGERRWNQDILAFIQKSGGRLREAADAIITWTKNGEETPVAAVEFCGALPAGNNAWQRQGRAFSFAHAKIPYFYVAELGGFELDANRSRKAERMPNPAIPFSFLAMTRYQGSVCLPVYEANAGASEETIELYKPIFGKSEFLKFLRAALLGQATEGSVSNLSKKCISLVERLANSKKRRDSLTDEQWKSAYEAVLTGVSLPNYLADNAKLPWKKTAYIDGLTETAQRFMAMGAGESLGLTSTSLPLSFVPKTSRARFSREVRSLYTDISDDFAAWLADDSKHLAICWVMGFKPRGDDARPDRGLPPLARMLIGDNCDLMTFVYGPAPAAHWNTLARDPVSLAKQNGLWEAVLAVSDGVLVDSSTKPAGTARGYLKAAWSAVLNGARIPLSVAAEVLHFGEQDVDTALHVAFEALGPDVAFEGMCNPPGGDWSGVSFRWNSAEPEHRWLTLPRVSAEGAKRPDHVFALFGHEDKPVCLCIESKEQARALDRHIGSRLTRYTEALFETTPSIKREERLAPWAAYGGKWRRRAMTYASAGAYLAAAGDPFRGVPEGSGLDVQIGVEFLDQGRRCVMHLRGDTDLGRALVNYLAGLKTWGDYVAIKVSN